MKKILYTIIIILLISIMLLSSMVLFNNKTEDLKQEQIFDNLQNTINDTTNQEKAENITTNENYHNLFECNNDMVGWLRIDNTNIDYPVMQTKSNPNYYLRKNFYKEYSYYGTPYIDEKCNIEDGSNLIIYGHHIKNNKMFGELEKYKNKNFYNEHRVVEFIIKDVNYTYQVVFVLKTDAITGFKYFNYTDLRLKYNFKEFVDNCKKLSLYKSDTQISFGDKFITLSTCEYSSENGRLAIIAKRL